ncbi:hypothetical protein [Nostoc sp. UHCC 0251]|uniref:hypothetical protein n=1 Tax=Nostoc sp. UHCC 0251 TaxID=3110240 RepID=UPI002B218822|nr:hypothetical protein [Nostoc sp. UHCC 0251]MEA5628206.1 hypothetical protein [Nostoc sp. UHCC 0251]
MKIEIQGQDAVEATKELLAIEGLKGSYQTVDELERGEPLTTIAEIVTILGGLGGIVTIAKEIYKWCQKYLQPRGASANPRTEKILIIGRNGQRLLLIRNVTEEQIRNILEDEVR